MMGRMSQEQPTDPTRLVPEGFVFPGTEMLDPHEVFAGPGYQAPQQRTDPVAAIVLVLTLLSPFPGFGATAAIMGWWALRRARAGVARRHRRLGDDRDVAVDLVAGLLSRAHGSRDPGTEPGAGSDTVLEMFLRGDPRTP